MLTLLKKIEFISILALAQKQAGINAINQTVGFIGTLAQITQNPAVLDKLNADEAVDVAVSAIVR